MKAPKKVLVRFLIWSLPIVSLFFLAVCVSIYTIESRNQEQASRILGREVVANTAVALQNWIADQVRIAHMIAAEPRVVAALQHPEDSSTVAAAQAYLKSLHARFPFYENLPLSVVLDPGKTVTVLKDGKATEVGDGSFITDTVDGKTIGKCNAQFSYIKAIREGRDHFISQVYPSLLRGNPIFVISAPVRDPSGRLVGVTVVAPQMSYFTELFIDRLHVGETGYLFFVDDRGMLIAHPEEDLILEADAVERMEPVTDRLFAGTDAFVDFNATLDDVDRYYCGHKVDIPRQNILHEWYLVYTQDAQEIQATSRRFLMILGWLGLGFLAVFAGGMYYLVRHLIEKPVVGIAQRLSAGADVTRQASRQVTRSSEALAAGSSQQASSIEETSSALEEMATMTRRNAENAERADDLVKESHSITMRADESMSGLNASMNEIAEASKETQRIIKNIDEIAFQTNLLALNAAVEAARAGDAGAGFAVVAEEVRSLAMRAAEAARDTAGLVENTVNKIAGGTEMVSQTSEAFGHVAGSAAEIKDLMASIATASKEQSLGIDQLNTSVSEMDKVTQQTAAIAQEAAANAQDMHQQSVAMKDAVDSLLLLVTGTSEHDEPPGARAAGA